jgi:hypothetical protein
MAIGSYQCALYTRTVFLLTLELEDCLFAGRLYIFILKPKSLSGHRLRILPHYSPVKATVLGAGRIALFDFLDCVWPTVAPGNDVVSTITFWAYGLR